MVPPLSAAIILGASLLSLYRITLNLPDLPYSAALKSPDRDEYKEMSERVRNAALETFKDMDGFYNVTILRFR
jgi:hypothetical protein